MMEYCKICEIQLAYLKRKKKDVLLIQWLMFMQLGIIECLFVCYDHISAALILPTFLLLPLLLLLLFV